MVASIRIVILSVMVLWSLSLFIIIIIIIIISIIIILNIMSNTDIVNGMFLFVYTWWSLS